MGWRRLEPGSLNLRVDDETVDRIGEAKELIFESPDEITYPEYYKVLGPVYLTPPPSWDKGRECGSGFAYCAPKLASSVVVPWPR